MASYEFRCEMCGIEVTVQQPISTDGDISGGNCSSCQIPLSRVWTSFGLTFKGTGWGHQ